jgi:hypothetical protein
MKEAKIAFFSLFIFLFCPLFLIYAQNQSGRSVFAPFISQLRGEVRNSLIRLTWVDSVDAKGPVYIYRAQTPFDEAHPYSYLRPIEVPYGAQSYIDEVETPGIWYYFISASAEQGQRYEIFIPFSNTLTVTVSEIGDEDETAFGWAGGSPASGARITGLEAVVRGDGVLVSYRLNTVVRNTVLYRSVNPVTRPQDLLNAVIVQDGINSPFMDYPVPGISYYYAVISEDELIAGNVGIFPGYNATITAAEVPAGSRAGLGDSPGIRSIPLPLISMSAVSPGGIYGDILPPTPLSTDAARAVNGLNLQGVAIRLPQKTPRVFSQDLEAPSGGEEYPLRSIVQGAFKKQDWNACRDEFLQYLSLPRSAAAESRARFYLGQAYYFTGSFREALFEFLTVQTNYPGESGEWIQATLAMLTN